VCDPSDFEGCNRLLGNLGLGMSLGQQVHAALVELPGPSLRQHRCEDAQAAPSSQCLRYLRLVHISKLLLERSPPVLHMLATEPFTHFTGWLQSSQLPA